MTNFIIANAFTLLLLVLMVNAKETLDLSKNADSKSEDLEQYVKGLIKSESEKSAKPELGILEKPMLSKKNAAESEIAESSMKHMKLLPESENLLKDESARYKATSANDNTHNEAVSPPLMPLLLQNDSTLAHHDKTIDSPTTRATVSIKNITYHRLPITYEQSKKLTSKGNNGNTSLSPPAQPESSKKQLKLAHVPKESSTPNSNEIAEFSIVPFDLDAVTDIINSMLFGTSDSDTTEALTKSYPEDVVTDVVVIEDLVSDGMDSITDQPEPQTSTRLFTETSMENPLLEAIALLDNLESEATTLLANNTFLPIDKFDFFVFGDNSNVPCILMAMNVTLSISYETKDQKHATTDYQLPNEIIVTGHCGHENSSVTLSWADHSPIINQNSITLNFAQDHSSFYVDSVQINIALDSHNLPNAKDAYITGNSSTNLKLFSAPVQNGIHICPKETKVTCGNIVATISNVTVIAYNNNEELSDRKEEYCNITSEIDQEVSVASILGGIVAAAIALAIVITVYSWCRRRSDITFRSELP